MTPLSKRTASLGACALGLVLLVVVGGWLWPRRGPAPSAPAPAQASASAPSPARVDNPAGPRFWPSLSLITEYPQIPLKGKTVEQAVREAYQRNHADRAAEWKVKMAFYGLVVDEHFRPVAGADVRFQWTDTSAQGHSVANAQSDAQGRFQLVGQHGKNLGVYVRKAGYYVPQSSRARSFEFANPADETYHEPDPSQPVLFRLRKAGPKVNLVVKRGYPEPPGDGSGVYFDFAQGKQGDAGQMWVQTWRPSQIPGSWQIAYPYDWRTILSIPDGGFVEKDPSDEFGFEAPVLGYTPTLDFAGHVTREDRSRERVVRTFYFTWGSPARYGRMEMHSDGGDKSLRLEYVFNPVPGERNLEYDEGALRYNSFEY